MSNMCHTCVQYDTCGYTNLLACSCFIELNTDKLEFNDTCDESSYNSIYNANGCMPNKLD